MVKIYCHFAIGCTTQKGVVACPFEEQRNLLLFMPTIKLLGTLTPHRVKNDSPTTVGGINKWLVLKSISKH
jgi:hypothetical protein